MKSHRRETYDRKREVRHSLCIPIAAESIGPITPGCEIYGLTGGQFSLVDIIVHCLQATGPADVTVSTWTAANADLGFAYRLLADGNIRSIRFIVDFSFPRREPEYCAALRERFGDEAIRITKNHCKFVLIRNEKWNLSLRTSMNLNENRRLENFEISDDAELCEYLVSVVDQMFERETGQESFAMRPGEHAKGFERLIGGDGSKIHESTDMKKYFGDGRFSNDIRRAGMKYERTKT